ncbi:MAG: hypothetical protein GX939_06140 [Clostridiaceae bacterium]|jgi:hypothetical protein|nr:hypothetical protein [Clostridiaceae bacterium]
MKKCLYCQTEIGDDAQFCGSCGRKQEPAETPAVEEPFVEAVLPQDTPGARVAPEASQVGVSYEHGPFVPPAPVSTSPSSPSTKPMTMPSYQQSAGAPQTMPNAPYTPPSYTQSPATGYSQAPPAGMPGAPYQPPQSHGAPPIPGGQMPPPPHGAYPPPNPPSALALDSNRYFTWLKNGIFGTLEPMHLLLASIAPFLVALFFTLGRAGWMFWHAGGFFLTWFFNMIMIAGLPVIAWLLKNHLLKQTADLKAVCSEYASYHTIPAMIMLVVMLLGLAAGGTTLVSSLFSYVRLLSLGAALMCLFAPRDQDTIKRMWKIMMIILAVFIVLVYLADLFLTLGVSWSSYKRFFDNLW